MSGTRLYSYIETFMFVAKVQSISEAARQLGLSQPAITKQMKLLEEHIGSPLMIRDHNGIQLTSEGQALLDQSSPLMDDLNRIVDQLRNEKDRVHGIIRLGALTEVGQYWIQNLVLMFRQRYPSVFFEIHYLEEREIDRMLAEGQLDFGFTTKPTAILKMESTPVLDERIVIVSRQQNALNIEDSSALLRAFWICYRSGDPLIQVMVKTHFANVSLSTLKVPISVNSHRSMIDALLIEDLFAVLPWNSVRKFIETRQLRIASKHELQGQIFLCSSLTLPRRRLKLFRDFVLEQRFKA